MLTPREVEIRACEGGFVPFLAPSGDLGGFREIMMPGAFKKTLRESASRIGPSLQSRGVRFGDSSASLSFQVIRDRWLQSHTTGEVHRQIVELRLIGVTEKPLGIRVSGRARAIARGARADFASRKGNR